MDLHTWAGGNGAWIYTHEEEVESHGSTHMNGRYKALGSAHMRRR